MIRRLLAAAGQSVRGVWEDIKASTDASLLGVMRFVGLLYGPIDRRLRIDEAFHKALRYRLPPHVGWRHAPGGITYLLFMVLVVTGVLLAVFYRPSVEEAYPSIQHIVSARPFGWLIRDVHHWSANLIVIALLAHMARVFFEAAYKPPRETNWLLGILLLGVVLAFGSTGYLLPWDQWSYWTVTEVMSAVGHWPIVGRALSDRLMGDVVVSGATLSRFFALHVIVLPWVAFVLLGYHFTLVRRRGIAPPMTEASERPRWRKSGLFSPEDEPEDGIPFFPNHLLRSFIVGTLTLAVTVTLAIIWPRAVAPPADPSGLPDRLVSTWVPVDVSLALIRLIGPWGLAAFLVLGVSLILIPLVDRGPERQLRRRPVVAAVGLTFFVGYVVLFAIGRVIGSVPPSGDLRQHGTSEQAVPTGPDALVPLPEPAGSEESVESAPPDVRGGER
jgi:quinol-cytochrome oxidoreductase complex cytochrome b subunit